MKYILLILVFNWIAINSSAQNIPNGGFENVNIDSISPEMSYPLDWRRVLFATLECFPPLTQGEITNESHNGDWAILMQTEHCSEIGMESNLPGGYVTGNSGTFFPYNYAFESNERPESLSFYYKFQREGNDSAFVEILLFKFDTVQSVVSDTIAYTIKFIEEEIGDYSLITIPIDYFSEDLPDFMHIEFGSGKNCTLNSCTPGTTFWVDDVEMLGGTLGIDESTDLGVSFQLYPNPAGQVITISVAENVIVEKVRVYEVTGRVVLNQSPRPPSPRGSSISLDVSNLKPGIYLIEVETKDGVREVKRVVIK